MIKQLRSATYRGTDGTYVWVVPTLDSKRKLISAILKADPSNVHYHDPRRMHMTVLYSREQLEPNVCSRLANPSAVYDGTIIGYDLFGPKRDCLVLQLDSPELQDLHKKWRLAGGTSDFTDYKPHVTLCYYYEPVSGFAERFLEQIAGHETLQFTHETYGPLKVN